MYLYIFFSHFERVQVIDAIYVQPGLCSEIKENLVSFPSSFNSSGKTLMITKPSPSINFFSYIGNAVSRGATFRKMSYSSKSWFLIFESKQFLEIQGMSYFFSLLIQQIWLMSTPGTVLVGEDSLTSVRGTAHSRATPAPKCP